ncbi:MAG: hypothetical protein ACHQEM_08290 [Chitinophagales bacterium]
MTGNPRQIILDMFGKEQLEDISVEELKEMVEEFPSFNALHFLLSKKLKSEGRDEFYTETERTALYFTNPFWLQWLLETEEEQKTKDDEPPPIASEIADEFEPIPVAPLVSEMLLPRIEETPLINTVPVITEVFNEENGMEEWHEQEEKAEITIDPEEHAVQEESPLQDSNQSFMEKPAEEVTHELSELNTGILDPDEMMEESLADIALSKMDSVTEESHYYHTEELPVEKIDLVEEIHIAQDRQDPVVEVPVSLDEPLYSGQESILDTQPSEPQNPIQRPYYFWEKEFYSKSETPVPPPAFTEMPAEATTPFEQDREIADKPLETVNDFIEEKEPTPAPLEIEQPDETLVLFDSDPVIIVSNVAVEPLAEIEMPNAAEETFIPKAELEDAGPVHDPVEVEEELKFEPYHTIDYFASQGIKYEQEENPTDKFGKQLKSFTAWLKTMKRLPKAGLESEMSDITEAAIQSIAEHSIEEKEVITEAMAEVLVLQGKTDKAIELYGKLSLLNPSKSAFFAARIEQIKAN